MNEFAVVLMKKDSDNIITEEVATIDIGSDAEYINSIFIDIIFFRNFNYWTFFNY